METKMKIINKTLPESYLRHLEQILVRRPHIDPRSELIQRAIRELLSEKHAPYQQTKQKLEARKEKEFYKYCISCNKRLQSFAKPYEIDKIKIVEIRFCCNCFKKFQNKKMNELPKAIQQKIEAYSNRTI